MLVDPNGSCPGTLEHVRNVCRQLETCEKYHDLKDVLELRKKEYAAQQATNVASNVVDSATNSTEYALKNGTKTVKRYIDGDNYIRLAPYGVTTSVSSGVVKGISTVSNVVDVVTVAWDVGDTWLSDNDNTTEQRWIKTGTILGGAALSVGVGALAVAAANIWNPAGWGLAAGMATIFAINFVGNIAINAVENKIYDYYSIE